MCINCQQRLVSFCNYVYNKGIQGLSHAHYASHSPSTLSFKLCVAFAPHMHALWQLNSYSGKNPYNTNGMIKIKSLLEELGLSKNESDVYMHLLVNKNLPASQIGKSLKIPRSTAKYACDQLVQKNIVLAVHSGAITYYEAYAPNHLITMLDAKRIELEKSKSTINSLLPFLNQLYGATDQIVKMQTFSGENGMIRMLEDVVNSKHTIYSALYLSENLSPKIKKYLKNHYIPKRKLHKARAYSLFNDNNTTKKYQDLDEQMNRVSLLIPEDSYPLRICYHIYGNKVSFTSYDKNNVNSVIITDDHIACMQMSMFKMAWQFALTFEINQKYKNIKL